ncbi:MAG: hypothetical protein ACI8XO_001632 [Verrucomicrobiales bacterium]|jgi:hypothetical protein
MKIKSIAVIGLAFGFLAFSAAAGELLFSDNFNAPDTGNLDLSDQTNRRAGLNTNIQVRSSRIQHGIAGNQLNFLNIGTGRIRFHNDLDGDVNTGETWFDWATGDVGAKILADGGLRIEFDWDAGNDASPNWISVNVGHNNEAAGEPAFRVNEGSNDIGILFRFNGQSELFDNGANLGAQGSFTPTIGLRHVKLDYAFSSFADGTPVTMTAEVDGTQVYTGNPFTWDGNAGEFFMEIGTLESTLIDQLSISTIAPDGFAVALDGSKFFSSIAQADRIGTLVATNGGSPEDAAFVFVTGAGDTDNSKFQIGGDRLEGGSFDFLDEPDGTEYSVRVMATGEVSLETTGQSFVLTLIADSDADLLPDAWELATAENLDDLSGLEGANFDGDSLSDLEEYQISLSSYPNINPTLADTDADNLEDGAEIAGAGVRPPTDPTSNDTDGDSLTDEQETNTSNFVDSGDTGSNPTLADTDGDLFPDPMEVKYASDPSDPLAVPAFSPSVSAVALTDDASSEIDPAKTYTHAISGGGTSAVNGVVFEELGVTVFPANFLWDTGGFTMAEIDPINNGDWLPADGGVTGSGLVDLFGSFTYSGTGSAGGAEQTYTLSGLSPGQSYSLRLYVRVWDTEGSGRPADISFSNGAETGFAPILEDRPSIVLGGGASDHSAYMIRYDYVAAGSEVVIRSAVPLGALAASGSFHLYALSNEIGGPMAAPKVTQISYDPDGPVVRITFESVPGQNYIIDFSRDLNDWPNLDDSFPSQGTTSTYEDLFAAGLASRLFYRIRVAPPQP